MFDTIENVKSLHEIETMEYDRARTYLINCRATYHTSMLIAHWKKTALPNQTIYGSKVYKVLEKFNVPVLTERTRKAHEVRSEKSLQKQNLINIFEPRPEQTAAAVKPEPVTQPKASKSMFTINLEGEWTGEQMTERIINIAKLLNNNAQYNIKIELTETRE